MLLLVPLAAGFVGSRPSPLVARGGCPADCHGNGVCINGVCRCDASWRGDDCGTSACPALCHGRGRCDFGSCVCEAGFTGIACESGASDGCPEHCSGHGWCIERSAIRVERAGVSSRSQCSCRPGWRGAACDVDTCPSHCSGHGTCDGSGTNAGTGTCTCAKGWGTDDCSTPTCPVSCGAHGTCIDGKCRCEAGFGGDDCGIVCAHCGEHGRCGAASSASSGGVVGTVLYFLA